LIKGKIIKLTIQIVDLIVLIIITLVDY